MLEKDSFVLKLKNYINVSESLAFPTDRARYHVRMGLLHFHSNIIFVI